MNLYNIYRCKSCNHIITSHNNKCGSCLFKNYTYEVPKFITRKIQNDNYYIDEYSITLDLTNEYKTQLLKHIKLLRIENYFTNLYKLIYKFYFKNKQGTNDLIEYYIEAAYKILKDKASIVLDKNIDPYDEYYTSYEWNNKLDNYSNDLQYIIDNILHVINSDDELINILGIEKNENPYLSQKSHQFVQTIIVLSFSLATLRIIDDYENDDYINIEIIKSTNEYELVIYLTHKGIISAMDHFINIDKEYRSNELNKILNKYGIIEYNSNFLRKQLNSMSLLEYNNHLYYQYHQFNLTYNGFVQENLNLPRLKSLLINNQINFKRSDL